MKPTQTPLAARMRPRTIDEFVGQEVLLRPGAPLRLVLEGSPIFSMILWGPPGSGKTTLAGLIEARTDLPFLRVSAVSFTVQQVRELAAQQQGSLFGGSAVLFVDEVHRLNKGQQDVLLPFVEDGTFILIGATTENPAYEVNRPLLSRCRVFRMEALGEEQLKRLLRRALDDQENGLGASGVQMEDAALDSLVAYSGGDARVALNLLEETVTQVLSREGRKVVDAAAVKGAAGAFTLHYDRVGDEHYNVISAFIKSMRGGDPDAALYYLARMLEAGEDPRFILRRMVICASEDVGNADPVALMVATAASQGFETVGMPEGQLLMAHAATYIATAPKSNSATLGIMKAREAVRGSAGNLPVPPPLRGSVEFGIPPPPDYLYSHSFPGHFVQQQYLPDKLKDTVFYQPTTQGREKGILERLQEWWQGWKKYE